VADAGCEDGIREALKQNAEIFVMLSDSEASIIRATVGHNVWENSDRSFAIAQDNKKE
jgi:hypothetical protein